MGRLPCCLCVLIAVLQFHEEEHGHKQRQRLRCHNRQPDAVGTGEDQGQSENSGDLEHQCSQERDGRRNGPIAQSREEGGRENVKHL